MMNKTEIGRWGEEIAAGYLIRNGYSILKRNFYTPEGEIDIIALQEEKDEQILIFVEVKTRTTEKYGFPEEAFTRKKWDHMLKAIERYLQSQSDYGDAWQIDVIAIQRLIKKDPPEIEHFENVVMNYDGA
jgi:putative endonuclease